MQLYSEKFGAKAAETLLKQLRARLLLCKVCGTRVAVVCEVGAARAVAQGHGRAIFQIKVSPGFGCSVL